MSNQVLHRMAATRRQLEIRESRNGRHRWAESFGTLRPWFISWRSSVCYFRASPIWGAAWL